jgi:SpoVK/Ycf46/Vps4 family AAA+-type ATPase
LNAAVEKDPTAIPIRLHLAQLLLDSGAEAAALEHFSTILDRDPANLEALRGAIAAADAVGDRPRANGYRRRLDELGGKSQPRAREEPSPAPEPAGREAVPVEADPAAGSAWWDVLTPEVTLADVGGMEDVKRRITVAFLGPLRNPELRQAFGKSLRGGLLLYGPPGCGKTFLARAVAGEMGARFIPIGLSDVLSMWLGQSERHLHELFETARRNAPCILFFDELDAIGLKRSQLTHSAGRNVVNQLLAELDGIGSRNEGVFTLGATNHPWDVDSALLRPGRFDRMALVVPPDQKAREAILQYHLRDRPVASLDLAAVARRTDGFSGADLAHVCETATEQAMEASMDAGAVRPIEMGDFDRALKQVRPSTPAWFETVRNFVLFANESGLYDDLLAYMRAHKLV